MERWIITVGQPFQADVRGIVRLESLNYVRSPGKSLMKRLTCLVLVGLLLASTAHAATVRTVALSGQPAPGTPNGVNYLGFQHPVLNDAGQTAFIATLTGSGVDSTNSLGVWSEGSGSLALVARSGSQAPGTPSGVNYFSFLGRPLARAERRRPDRVSSPTYRGVGNTNDTGIWSEGSGSLALVARSGNQAPGTPSGGIITSRSLALNDAGHTAF